MAVQAAKDTLATKQDALVLRHDLAELRTELKADLAGLRTELKADMTALRGELRSEIHAMASSVARQMYAAIMGQFALLLGLAYFFVSHLQR